MSDKAPPAQDPQTGRFLPGNNGGPGRPRGSRQKLSDAFFHAMAKAFDENGETALAAMVREKPADFIKTIAGLQTKEISGEDGTPLYPPEVIWRRAGDAD